MTIYLTGLGCRFYRGKNLCQNFSLPLQLSVRNETHYDVLKLSHTCTAKDIRDAFINLSKENHPDKHPNDPSMHSRFVKINEAYRMLIKPSSRHAYDMSLGFKRKLSPPQYANSVYSTSSTKHPYGNRYGQFHDPFMWHNVTSNEKSSGSYYGIKGVKKLSNYIVLCFIFAFTVIGVAVQVVIIKVSSSKRNEYMLEQSRKNSLLESMIREKAKLYGNEHQIQVLKNSLKATCEFNPEGTTIRVENVEQTTPVVLTETNKTTDHEIITPEVQFKSKKAKPSTYVDALAEDEFEHSIDAIPVCNET